MKKEKTGKKLFSGAVISVAASFFIGVFSYFVRRFLANSLSVNDYAKLYSLFAIGTLAVGVFRFGTAEAILFVLSGMKNPSDDAGKRFFSGVCLWNALIFSIIMLVFTGVFLAGFRPAAISDVSLPTLLIFLPFLFLSAFEAIFGNTFNSLSAFAQQYGLQVLKAGLMMVGASVTGGVLTNAILAFNLPLLTIFLISVFALRVFFRPEILRCSWRKGIQDNIQRCLWLWLISFSPMIFNELPTILLSCFSSAREVAFFNIAVPVAMIVRTFYCVAMVFVPFAGEMKNSGDLRRLSLYILGSAGCSLLVGLVMIPVFYLFGRGLIRILFGEVYMDALFSSFLLSEAMTIAFSGQVNINTLNTQGHEKTSAWITLLVALLVLGGCIPLGLVYGANGVAASCLIGAFFWSMISGAVLLKQSRLT